MNVYILDRAEEDLANGHQFYEQQESGLGNYFLRSLISDIDTLEENAGIHPVYNGEHYQMFCSKFPYAIYYLIENGDVLVDAVIDCRRDPDWINDRLN